MWLLQSWEKASWLFCGGQLGSQVLGDGDRDGVGGGGRFLGFGFQDGQFFFIVSLGQVGYIGRSIGVVGVGIFFEIRFFLKSLVLVSCICRGSDFFEGFVVLFRKGIFVRKLIDGCVDFYLLGGRILGIVRRYELEWGCWVVVFQEGLQWRKGGKVSE